MLLSEKWSQKIHSVRENRLHMYSVTVSVPFFPDGLRIENGQFFVTHARCHVWRFTHVLSSHVVVCTRVEVDNVRRRLPLVLDVVSETNTRHY